VRRLRHPAGEETAAARRVQHQNRQHQPRAQIESHQPAIFHGTTDEFHLEVTNVDDNSPDQCRSDTRDTSNTDTAGRNRPEVHNTDTHTPVVHRERTPGSFDSCQNGFAWEYDPPGRTIDLCRKIGLAQTGWLTVATP